MRQWQIIGRDGREEVRSDDFYIDSEELGGSAGLNM
jgi:hypothetical protein